MKRILTLRILTAILAAGCKPPCYLYRYPGLMIPGYWTVTLTKG